MTKDEIIEMLAKVYGVAWTSKAQLRDLTAFAKLIAQHEREVCAKICDAINNEYDGEEVPASWIATAIRSRGNT